MSDAAQIFNEAYDLIEQGDLASARQLLDDIRADNEANPDFWWLYAHAVEDEESGREALQRVRQLNPQYPGLDNLTEKAGMAVSRPSVPPPLPPMRPPQDIPTSDLDSDDEFEDTEVDFDPDTPGAMSNTVRNFMLLGAAAVVVLVLIVLLIPNIFGGRVPATETPGVAINATDVLSVTSQAVDNTAETVDETETDESPTVPNTASDETATSDDTENVSTDYADWTSQLGEFNVPEDGIEVGETSLGNTLLITTCSRPGPAATQAIVRIAEAIEAEQIAEEIEAIGFQIANCDADTIFVTLGVSRSEFDDFADDTISSQELQGLLRPI